ncbi:DUF3139 domain-containing protein [Brevibacillus laterosporus]|nr:DUF3139 domain-containing protein [Brevibacillus laterosporus]TPG86965.1 DUF3139 domain-containing protein [Brevibacillus laterosporus]
MVIIGILFVFLLLLFIGYNKYTLYSLEKDTFHYLISEKGYKETEIKSISGKISKAPVYSIEVIFNDEPDVTYIYRKKESGQIILLSKSSENNKSEYKHWN